MGNIFKSKFILLGAVSILALGALTGCANSNAAAPIESTTDENIAVVEDDALKGRISVVGSTSVTPVAQALADEFMAMNPEVRIDVQGVGSSAGVKAANDGSAEVGMSSRNLKETEKGFGLDEHVIAHDGIAVIVHPNNEVQALTAEQVTQIFKGEITNWKDVGGKDEEILIVSRESGSGTRGAFEELMDIEVKNADGKKVSGLKEDALIAEGNGAVKANVAKKEYAIGYVSLSYLDESIQTVAIDGVEPSTETIIAGEYAVSRPFLMLTKGDLDQVAEAYLEFILSDAGQEIVSEKLIPVK